MNFFGKVPRVKSKPKFVLRIWMKFFGKVPRVKSKPKFVFGYDY